MKRRTCLKALLAAGAGPATMNAASANRPVVVSGELVVDPENEEKLLKTFRNEFRPAAAKQPGFIDMKMLKVRPRANAPAGGPNYRFQLTFQSEELRQKWVATDDHKRIWPVMQSAFKSSTFTSFDDVTEA
jgi:heme-degrading monooxygenase HmoA